MAKSNVQLRNIYSREKTLLYYRMWDDSDRKGYSKYLRYTVKNNLFIVPLMGKKGSVWYDPKELLLIEKRLASASQENPAFIQTIIHDAASAHQKLTPYLTTGIKTTAVFKTYYNLLVDFWAGLNTIINIPDSVWASEKDEKAVLHFRAETEKNTEHLSEVLTDFVTKQFPSLKEPAYFIDAKEIITPPPQLRSILQTRANGCFLFNRSVFPLSELSPMLSKKNISLEKEETNLSNLVGTIAQPGKVRGRAIIVNGFADLARIQKGDILVTQMTNPKYSVVFNKIAAIVTDEGGVTCHAAIVSRELKIPCIVGTKMATQWLKDGDWIEVDAEKGLVKKVSK